MADALVEFTQLRNKLSTQEQGNTASSELQFHPKEYWGLDYFFRTFNKMYIQDILQMKEYPMFPEAYAYKNHPIYKVDVLGVVVKVTQNQKCFMYTVDDGTGTIVCCCWKTSLFKGAGADDMCELPAVLHQKAKTIMDAVNRESDGYMLGDLINVKGKIKVFREQREIVASSHHKVTDANAELHRMAELPKLYKQNYDKPFILPHKVAQMVAMVQEEEKTGVRSEKRTLQELHSALLEHFQYSQSSIVSLNQLTNLPAIHSILSQKAAKSGCGRQKLDYITQVVHQLQADGHVCQRTDKPDCCEVLSNSCPLDETIKKILIRDCTKPKYVEKGCHYLHIVDELRKTYQYSKIQTSGVQTCLQKLEANSDVIRTTPYHYIYCNT